MELQGTGRQTGNKETLNNWEWEKHPLAAFNFILRVEAMYDLPCRRVTGISQEQEYEYIQEGGVNDYVHIVKKPVSKPYSFQVERYIGVDYVDPLALGARLDMPVQLLVNRTLGNQGKTELTLSFSGCVVTGKSYGEVDAEHSGLLLETTTIAYQRMAVEAE